MNDAGKRVVGYGLVAVISGALIYGGFVYKADPELSQMVSSVEMQLGLAGTMANHAGGVHGKDGKVLGAIAELLDGAKSELDLIDEAYPGHPAPRFLRGHVAFLEGRYVDATALYGEVRTLEGCDPELRDRSVINQAVAMTKSGQREQAVRLLNDHEFADPRYSEMARNEIVAATRVAEPKQQNVESRDATAPQGGDVARENGAEKGESEPAAPPRK